MLVEFEVVTANQKEKFDKELQADLTGESSVEYFNEKDVITKYVLDLDRIIGFRETTVYHNSDSKPGVVCELEDSHTPVLVISYPLFKEVYEKYTHTKIKNVIEL